MSGRGMQQSRGRGDPVSRLTAQLDAHIVLMRGLVEVAQREQQHLLAFETRALAASTEEKRALMGQIAGSEASVREALAAAQGALEFRAEEATVAALARALPGSSGEALEARASILRSLAGTLQELQAMSLVHAERGLLFVTAYTSLLRGAEDSDAAEPIGIYDASGRQRPAPSPGSTVSRNA